MGDFKAYLAVLRAEHGRAGAAQASQPVQPMPDLLALADCPNMETLAVRPSVRDFLIDGTLPAHGDRSRAVYNAAVAMYSAGLNDQQVFSVLVHSPAVMEIALGHRRQDDDKAMDYLWKHHCVNARPKAVPVTESGFDGVPMAASASSEAASVAPFFMKSGDFKAMQSRMEWIVKGVLPQAEVAVVYGPSGSGKTFFVTRLACCIALGEPFYGIPVQRMPVAVAVLEGANGYRQRIKAYESHYEANTDADMYVRCEPLNLLEPSNVKAMIAGIQAIGPKGVLVIDTMAQATPGADENSGQDMGRALAHVKAIHRATGWTVILVAHTGKDARKGVRGWSGIRAALDAEIEVTRTDNYRAATITKLKDGRGEGDEYRFTVGDVELGSSDDGDNTAGVMLEGALMLSGMKSAVARPQRVGANQQAVLDAYTAMESSGDVSSSALLREAADRMPDTEKRKRPERARVALNALVTRGTLARVGGNITRPLAEAQF